MLDDGERLSMLVDDTGMPIYFLALFITTQVRNAGRSANTISADLVPSSVCICGPMPAGSTWSNVSPLGPTSPILNLNRSLPALCAEFEAGPPFPLVSQSSNTRGGARAKIRKGQILSHGKYRNLTYIGIYLCWLAARLTERAIGMVDQLARGAIKDMAQSIETKRPRRARRSIVNAPKGLQHAEESRLLNFVSEQVCQGAWERIGM
ncbi:hypothetical protein CA260_16875 [Dyella jiangningensis]|uniref:Uncharacterized protein n=1 Tax=Dyella jiangningensis TaxID=1379159 RepID=A0A328P0G7_9GAMM|nr:hypothetical protein CA260_16875 [Dyella jiangningensis]